jgi:hypothetical protein
LELRSRDDCVRGLCSRSIAAAMAYSILLSIRSFQVEEYGLGFIIVRGTLFESLGTGRLP